MYQAIAEKVSGKNVFAGGKWLTCIGNKSVSVGERIYTDGRCVYGFYKESQQPMVITRRKVEEYGIPILVYPTEYFRADTGGQYPTYYRTRDYYTYKNGLSKIRRGEMGDSKYLMINGYDDQVYCAQANPTDVTATLYELDGVFAANIDKAGNLYQLISKKDSGEVELWVNREVVKTINYSQNDDDTDQTIGWGFIENENNWAFIVTEDKISNRNYYEYYPPEIVIPQSFSYSGATYYYTPEGRQEIFSWSGSAAYEYYADTFEDPDRLPSWMYSILYHLHKGTENFTPPAIKFPMQDGYYYTISKGLPLPARTASAPTWVYKNIFSPNDDLIYSGWFQAGSYLTIYKNLLGVGHLRDHHTLSDALYEDGFNRQENYAVSGKDLINSGLYSIESGKLTKLIEDKYNSAGDLTAVNVVLNQRLRPMKNYKNWTDKIIDFTNWGAN